MRRLSVHFPVSFPIPYSVSRCPSLALPFPSRVLLIVSPAFRFLLLLVSAIWRRSSSLSPSTFLLKHLRRLNFHPFLALSHPVRSSSGLISRVAASLAVFSRLSVFRFRVPLMSYAARNGRRFRVVFQISSVVFVFFLARAKTFLSFSIKITLIFKRSRPVLSHPVPPTRLPALYYL